MSYKNFYLLTFAFTTGLGISIIIMILGTSLVDDSEPSIKIQKWHDVEGEVTCYWVQPRPGHDTIALSCVREKEQEE